MVEPQRMRIAHGVIVGSVLAVVVGLADMGQAQSTPDRSSPYVVSWNRTLPTEMRFVVLANFNSEAVLDQNTGLVWERSPAPVLTDWKAARFSCLNKTVGGQRGWRLPSIVELTSLLDPSVQDSGSMLPSGHPFLNNPSGFYWSASTDGEPSKAWHLHVSNGYVHMTGKVSTFKAWCVRGASTGDQ
ncbi:MAG: DUF1566 domain-containing protein [Nitrospira sp.]|nr:DUF1566 domain-containing protein [Nitrospira sp.]